MTFRILGTQQRVLGHAVFYRAPDLRLPFHIPPRSDMELVDWTSCAIYCNGIVDGVLRSSYLSVYWIQDQLSRGTRHSYCWPGK